jgi:hypothetical protein
MKVLIVSQGTMCNVNQRQSKTLKDCDKYLTSRISKNDIYSNQKWRTNLNVLHHGKINIQTG